MTLQPLLDELLAEPRERMEARAAGEFDRIAAPFENRIVLFGSAHLGKLALTGLRAAGVEPLAFCDNNSRLWDTRIEGVPVLSPATAAAQYGDSAAFVTTIYNPAVLRSQLRELGCGRVVPYPALFWKYWRSMPGEDRLELPHRILERASEMGPAYEMLSDEKSRREFCAQIRWRCLLDSNCLPQPDPSRDMYFPPDLWSMSPREVFVDCGAFDGDSIRGFLQKTAGRFGHIHAVEADAANVQSLRRYCAELPADVSARITVLPHAVGKEDGTVRFCAGGLESSKVAQTGATLEVECRSLDSALDRDCPTLIKMDIEGAELDALLGAAKTMARCHPVMAVCAYHKCDHLWIIPKLLKAAHPDYQIFLRRYAEDCWETVYYAVPPERSVSAPPVAEFSPNCQELPRGTS
jgi:FkbM family methyltransferase